MIILASCGQGNNAQLQAKVDSLQQKLNKPKLGLADFEVHERESSK
ncbi:MAG TPA: hypothetical protein VHS53_07950 [Mucilaginibacter sp.]|nr:hypothetical protein [Mucilaginibacter sp.]